MPRITISRIISLLTFLTTFERVIGQDFVDIPPNPCPNVFSYVRDNRDNIMGKITLPNNGEGYINLEINVSLATNINNPQIELQRIDQDLTDCEASIYFLHLPFTNNIPRITRISFNGDVLCSGPKEALIPGGRTVWNLWRQSSYETSQQFSCQNREKPTDNSGFFLNIGNVNFNKPFNQNNDFNAALFNSIPTVPPNALATNPFLTGRFPDSIGLPINPTTPPPIRLTTQPKPQAAVTRGNQCGMSKSTRHVTNLSFGGVDVPEGEFPWMAALMHRSEANTITLACTVTLVSLKFVITRGHCIDLNGNGELDKDELLVVLGTRDISNWFVNSLVRNVSNVIVRSGIEPNKASNDIALIEMDKEVPYTPGKIVPICLWFGRSDTNDNGLDKLILLNPGTVVGWGTTNTTTTKLNKILVPVIDHLRCIQSSSLPPNLVEANTFCGGYSDGQTGTCDTDAGASFGVQKVEGGPWYLRGILSITPSVSETQCNLKGYSLYVDLADHYPWLHNIINRNSF